MAIELSPIKSEVDFVQAVIKIIHDEIFQALARLGEECVKKVKDRTKEESWCDQTGNLRSSIGYAIYDQGEKLIQSAFKQVLEGSEGTKEGAKYIDELASQYAQVYALVIVAGMSYAEYVEARDNKDVLASTELWAKSEIQKRLDKAAGKAVKKIDKLKF